MKSGSNNPKPMLLHKEVMTGIIFGQTLHGWDELQRCSIDFDFGQIEDTEMEF